MYVGGNELQHQITHCYLLASICIHCLAAVRCHSYKLPRCRYNIGHVAVGIGDLGLAYQCFKIAVSVNANHAESYNNLGVLDYRKGNDSLAKSSFKTGQRAGEHVFELFYNGALLAFKTGEFQESFDLAKRALEIFPDHSDSQELLKQLKNHFSTL
jgi:tetratricopeptide repeat protein 8